MTGVEACPVNGCPSHGLEQYTETTTTLNVATSTTEPITRSDSLISNSNLGRFRTLPTHKNIAPITKAATTSAIFFSRSPNILSHSSRTGRLRPFSRPVPRRAFSHTAYQSYHQPMR